MLLTKSLAKGLTRLCIFCLLVLTVSSSVSLAQSPPATVTVSPDVVAKDFYRWYLGLLVENKDPMHDEVTAFSKYVSSALAKEIERKIHSADGMEADYFIQAQDYLDDWPTNVSVATPRIKGALAAVTVSLGAAKPSSYRLTVTLVKENDTWKIRRVARAGPQNAGG